MAYTYLYLVGILSAGISPATSPGHTARWSAVGHRLVGRIADSRLTPTARAQVTVLLNAQGLADVAVWADSIRPSQRSTAPWHYVNIPINASGFDRARDCPDPPGCIISAIERFERVLRDPTAPDRERARALRFLVHFVGDLHQPLHTSDDHDRGGNDVQVQFLGRTTNLHSVWDGGLIRARGLRESAWDELLQHRLQTANPQQFLDGTVVDWANQSHDLARDKAYALPPSRQLDVTYATSRALLIEEALIRAGVRLGHLVNRALDPGYARN